MKRFAYFKPNLGQSFVVMLFFFLGSALLGGIASVLGIASKSGLLQCQSLSYLLSMLVPTIYIFIKASKLEPVTSPVPLNAPHFAPVKPAVCVVLVSVAMMAMSVIIEPATSFIPMPDSIKAIFEAAFVNLPLWDSILSTCILAPICEEFLCRGIMCRGMMQHRSPWSAILWSAFIFAVMHLNPWQSIPAFLIGVFFGWVYWKTGSLWTTILLHSVNNTFSTVLARLSPNDIEVDDGFIDLMPKGQYIALYAVSLIVFIVIILFLQKKYDKKTLSAEV